VTVITIPSTSYNGWLQVSIAVTTWKLGRFIL